MLFLYIYFVARLNIVYPMLFKLTNRRANRSTHCGVLEFVADEGKAFIPHWVNRFQILFTYLFTTYTYLEVCDGNK